jgi:hypothetical protein
MLIDPHAPGRCAPRAPSDHPIGACPLAPS